MENKIGIITVGSIIRIKKMVGEPNYEGKEGVVEHIDDAGQLHGTWGGCALIPGVDEFEALGLDLETFVKDGANEK